MFCATPLDIAGPLLLLEKLRSVSLQRWRSVLARFQMNSPRELSLACVFAWKFQEFPCGVTTFEKWPFLYHSINLDRSFRIIHCTSQWEVLIGLFTGGLTNNRKNHFFDIREIDTGRGKKFPLSAVAFSESAGTDYRVVRAFCKVFLRRFCRPFVQHMWCRNGDQSRWPEASSDHYPYPKRCREKTRVSEHKIGHVTRRTLLTML